MTRADIFIQIISEISDIHRQETEELLAQFRKTHPGGTWDQELSPDQSRKLLAELRVEGPGILNWLISGRMDVAGSTGHA